MLKKNGTTHMLNSYNFIYVLNKSKMNINKVQYNIKKRQNKENKESIIKKGERDTRHYLPSNKEWNNSMYTYNKGYLSDIMNKDKIAYDSITSYFNLTPVPHILTKSKRMRDLLRRSTTNQIFFSKPEIKQTNDKAIVTIYSFDREKKQFFRKLFFLRRWLNESLAGTKLKLRKSRNRLISKYTRLNENKGFLIKKHITYNRRFRFRKRRIILKKYLSRYNVKSDLYKKTGSILLKKKSMLTNLFIYLFFRRILKMYNLKVKIEPIYSTIIRKGKKPYKKSYKKAYVNLIFKKVKKKVIRIKDGRIRHIKSKWKKTITIRNSYLNIKVFRRINVLLYYWLLNKRIMKKNKQLTKLFIKMKSKYGQILKENSLKKELLIVQNLCKLYINKFKFFHYLPSLKSILSKIYDKKIIVNLVNLKNIYLNSEMFSKAISIKLRKKKLRLVRVLRKSFSLIKSIKPNKKYIIKRKQYTASEIKTYFGKNNVVNGKIINRVFNDMYSKNIKLNRSIWTTTIRNMLRTLKYKWVTGIRIEAKGRLTRRYAASRAIFKYKYKGTLRNLEYLKNIENKHESSSIFMSRGDSRPNTQYSLIHTKRRIGAFGIKGWIGNN